MSTARSFREVINERPDWEFFQHPRAEWRLDVTSGATDRGYGEVVQDILETLIRETPLPAVLRQFVPAKPTNHSTRNSWRQTFLDMGWVNFIGSRAMVHVVLIAAFENLRAFLVLEGSDGVLYVVNPSAAPGLEKRAGVSYDVLYEWDGQVVPDYTELKPL